MADQIQSSCQLCHTCVCTTYKLIYLFVCCTENNTRLDLLCLSLAPSSHQCFYWQRCAHALPFLICWSRLCEIFLTGVDEEGGFIGALSFKRLRLLQVRFERGYKSSTLILVRFCPMQLKFLSCEKIIITVVQKQTQSWVVSVKYKYSFFKFCSFFSNTPTRIETGIDTYIILYFIK